jgi:hypothetical protein
LGAPTAQRQVTREDRRSETQVAREASGAAELFSNVLLELDRERQEPKKREKTGRRRSGGRKRQGRGRRGSGRRGSSGREMRGRGRQRRSGTSE